MVKNIPTHFVTNNTNLSIHHHKPAPTGKKTSSLPPVPDHDKTKTMPAHRRPSICRHLLPALLLSTLCPAQTSTPLQQWTNSEGKQVEASFGGLEGENVKLILPNGSTVDYPLSKLSPADQAKARSLATTSPAEPSNPNRLPPEKRQWPDKVEVSARTMERLTLVSEEPANRKYIYQTSGFEFMSQDKLAGSVMLEIARTFEATKELINALPWGIVCRPPPPLERYQAALYETRQDYFLNGGPENSGGVYDSGDQIFKIPFPSLGLERRGKTWFKNDSYTNDTLVHEITHQMMHDYLPFLPKWIIEGSAEYTELLPYSSGTFRVSSHKSGIKDYLSQMTKRRVAPDLGSIKDHFTMTRSGWDSMQSEGSNSQITLYFRSAMLVYFFNHLDGDGSGKNFIRFFDAVYNETEAYKAFFAHPDVKKMPGGRFTYPSSLTPPDTNPDSAPFKHTDLLLNGRDFATLATEIVEGFRSIGVKITATP
jgi:hypothetical protein